MDKKQVKKVIQGITIVLGIILIVKLSIIGYYPSEAPMLFGVTIVEGVLAYIGSKIHVDEEDEPVESKSEDNLVRESYTLKTSNMPTPILPESNNEQKIDASQSASVVHTGSVDTATKICPQCGSSNKRTNTYCSQCGLKI